MPPGTSLEPEPQNALEEAMVAAQNGRISTEDFLRLLVRTPLFLPSRTPGQVDGSGLSPLLWTQGSISYLALYTAQARMDLSRETAPYVLQVVGGWVLSRMPPGSGFVLNAGSTLGGQFEPGLVQEILRDLLPGPDDRQAVPLAQTRTEHKVFSLQFLPDTLTLLGGTNRGDVAQWRYTGSLDLVSSFSADTTLIYKAALDSTGTRVAVAGRGPLRVWRLPEGEMEWEGQFDDRWLGAAAFSPDGTWLLAAGDEEELHVIHWSTKETKFRSITALDPEEGSDLALGERTMSIVFHPDGRTVLLTCSWQAGSALKFCTLDTELTPLPEWDVRLPADVLSGAAFSPDGRSFAFADWEAHLYSFPARERVLSFDVQGNALPGPLPQRRTSAIVNEFWSNPLFTPDGRTLICGSPTGAIFLWDLPGGTLRQTLTGHDGGIIALALDASGTRLASCGEDKTLRLWQMPGPGTLS